MFDWCCPQCSWPFMKQAQNRTRGLKRDTIHKDLQNVIRHDVSITHLPQNETSRKNWETQNRIPAFCQSLLKKSCCPQVSKVLLHCLGKSFTTPLSAILLTVTSALSIILLQRHCHTYALCFSPGKHLQIDSNAYACWSLPDCWFINVSTIVL